MAVPTCQCLIQLKTGRRYLISVRAVNIGGPSDRSEVLSVSTTGEIRHKSHRLKLGVLIRPTNQVWIIIIDDSNMWLKLFCNVLSKSKVTLTVR